MKKIYISMAIAAAFSAAMMVSCAKEESFEGKNAPVETIEMSVNASMEADTKVDFGALKDGAYPVLWSKSGEAVRVYERVDGSSWSERMNSVQYTPSEDFKTATFKLNINPKKATSFDYFVVYPSTGLTYQIKSSDAPDKWLNTVRLGTAGTQTPKAAGVDSKFTFLIGSKEGLSKQPSSLDVTFKHVLAYGKMHVTDFAIAPTDTLSNIRITFNDKAYVTGFVDYRTAENMVDLTRASASKNYIDINPKNVNYRSGEFDVWFGIAPMTIEGGESITLSFTTKEGDVTKTAFLDQSKPMEFRRGRVLEFPVSMTGTSIPKKLQFDFSQEDGKLPTAAKTPNAIREYVSFKMTDQLSGKDYTFYNAGGAYHGAGKNYTTLYDGASTGYFGLPAVPGYKLSRITLDRANATGANVYVEVVSDIANKTVIAESVLMAKGVGNPPAIVISGAKENTVYYLHALQSTYVPFNALTLEYEVASAADAHPSDYDVFLLLGQSNMAGRGDYVKDDCWPVKNVYIFTGDDETVLYGAQPLYNMFSSIRKGYAMQKCNLGGPFAEKVNETTGKKVLLVVNARGGTSIENWMKDAGPMYFSEDDGDEGYLWNKQMPNFLEDAVRRAKAAQKYGTLRAVLWHQGEGNSTPEKAAAYMNQLKTFVSDLRGELGMTPAQLPFIVGELNYALEGAANLNPVLNTVSTNIENSACVSAAECESESDNTHFTLNGLTVLGQRYAEAYLSLR